jgi:hypothetical protein
VVQFLARSAKKQLTKLYKSSQHILKDSLPDSNSLTFSLHHTYDKTVGSIHEIEQKNLLLVERILLAKQVAWRAKEQLFNQAIFESENQLKEILERFSDDLQKQLYVVSNK